MKTLVTAKISYLVRINTSSIYSPRTCLHKAIMEKDLLNRHFQKLYCTVTGGEKPRCLSTDFGKCGTLVLRNQMVRELIGTWMYLLAVGAAAQACTEAMKGDRHCDQVCMTANADFDSSNGVSDCREMCLGHCSERSSCQASCLTWDCAWGEGKCGECAAGCEKAWLGNGQCEAACNVEKCSFDAGDCSTSSSPNTAYVSARSASSGDGSWAAPFPSLAPALEKLWLPFNSVYLLAGSHLLYPTSSSSLLTNEVLTETVIATLFCTFQPKDHLQCATSRAVIQLTAQFTSFTVLHTVVFESVIFEGGFSLKSGCALSTCLYCPYVHFNTTLDEYQNDRGENIHLADYAVQSICDFYHDKSFLVVSATGNLTVFNSLFASFRQQLKAIIWNECGDIHLINVDFDRCMSAPQGLSGGLFGQACPDSKAPYDCGTFSFLSGSVSGLNDGYEYRPDIVLSGFLSADGLQTLLLESVLFEYNFLPVGERISTMDSTMLFLNRFRTATLTDCIFRYNIASLSVGLTVLNSFQFHLVLDSQQVATEQTLRHITLSGLTFYNNTAEKGTLLYVGFSDEHQNILIANCTFVNNFSRKGALISVQNDGLAETYKDGDYVNMLLGQAITAIWVPPRYFNMTNVEMRANFAQGMVSLANIGNVVLREIALIAAGESPGHITGREYVLNEFIARENAYISAASLAFPVVFSCKSGIVIENALQIMVESVRIEEGYCPQGSPGIAVLGSPTVLLFQHAVFANNIGSELLLVSISTAIPLHNITFTHNTNYNSSKSVCLSIAFTQPSDISITNSSFLGNEGDTGAVGTLLQARNILLTGLLVHNNRAKYSAAGFIVSPGQYGLTTVRIQRCGFRANTADSKGVVSVFDYCGNLSGNYQSLLALLIEECEFSENYSNSQGAAITIHDNIHLSSSSSLAASNFTHNSCDTGASIYLSYQSGTLTVSASTFSFNTAPNGGAGIYATQSPDTLDHPTFVLVTSCVFRYNAGPAIGIEGSLLLGAENRFEGNFDSAVTLQRAQYADSKSEYVGNTAEYGAALFLTLASSARFQDCLFSANAVRESGGAAYTRFFAPITFLNCTFSHNFANKSGGVLYTETSPGSKFKSCLLTNNSAGNAGVLLTFSGSVLFVDSELAGNRAEDYALVVMMGCRVELRGCLVAGNVASERTSGLYLTSSELVISDSQFTNHISANGGFLLSLNNNLIHILRCSFTHAKAEDDGGAIYNTLESELHITSSTFYNCSSGHLGGAIYNAKSVSITTHVTFVSTTSVLGGAIDMFDGSGWVENCNFEDISGSAVHVDECESLTVINSTFTRSKGMAYRGAGIYTVNVVEVKVANSSFEANEATKGGGAYFYSNAQGNVQDRYFVTGNRFVGNRAMSGAGLESDGVNLRLEDNTFVRNLAVHVSDAFLDTNGVGGGVTLRCDNPVICDIAVVNNFFVNNSADIKGGAVHWQETPPVFLNNRFEGNTAEYGSTIASYPIALAPVSSSLQPIPYEDNSTKVPIAFSLDGFVSGQLFTVKLKFGLFDHLWQRVATANNSIMEIQVPSNTTLSGQFKGSSSAGIFEMSGFAITAEPGSSRYIYFSTHGVDISLKGLNNDSARYIDTVAVKVNFRLCEWGETVSSGACVLCEAETYSLQPQQPCKTCLSTAICYGGFLIVPKAGYWRAKNDTETFFECFNPDACIGSPEPPDVSLVGLCADGYSGHLCQVCLPNYSRTGRNNCARCPGKTANISISTLIILVALCAIALIVGLAIRGATRPRSLIAIYFKIFLNYLQMVIVAASLNLNWPSFVKTFLSTQEMAGGMAEQLFSFECLLHVFEVVAEVGMYSVKLVLGALLPLAVMLLAVAAWLLLCLLKKVEQPFEKVVASCVVVLFIVHPSITKMMFSVYSCLEILPGESWVIADLSEQCWTARHFKSVVFISIPSIAVWVLGLPTLVLGLLVRARMKLHELPQRVKFSFLFKGYDPKWFYWEFVILYRKIAIVSVSVFLAPMSVRVESLTILAILLAAVYLQLRYQPYNEETLNKLEIKSILVSAVTIYAGLYYDTHSMSTVLNLLLFILIVMVNAYFLVTWVVYISPVLLLTLRQKWAFFKKFSKPYRVRPFQPASPGLKDIDKLSSSSNSQDISSSSPLEGTVQPTDNLFPPSNTPNRLVREATDPADPGLSQDFSIR